MTQELASAAVSETSAAGTGKIGSALRALRESKGWSVDEVSSRIKFSARQIEALENEQWADLPSGVSLRGLIRNYARLLGADSQAIVESLDPKERVTGPVKLSPARCIPRIPFPVRGRRRAFLVGVLGLADRHRAGAGRRRGLCVLAGLAAPALAGVRLAPKLSK